MPTRGAAFCAGAGAFVVGVGSHGAALGGRPRRPVVDMLGANRWPSAGAALDLDFVNRQAYAYGFGLCKPDDLLTYTGSGGTRVNEAGLVAAASGLRYDYDPISVACKGLLIEEARTNLITQSEFANGVTDAPTRGGLITASAISGFAGALAFGYDGTTDSFAYKNFTPTIGATYVFSALVAMDDGLAPSGNGVHSGSGFDFELVVAGSPVPGPYAVTAMNTKGLYRVSVVYTATLSVVNFGLVKYHSNSSRTFKATAYQLESGSFLTSYIPTSASTASRTSDAASLFGANFSPWFNRAQGTFLAEFQTTWSGPADISRGLLTLDNNVNERVFYVGASAQAVSCYDGTTIVGSTAVATGAVAKAALAFDGTTRRLAVNGAAPSSGPTAAGFWTGSSSLAVGALTSNMACAWMRRVRFYPQALPDSTLQLMTQ